MTPIMLRLLFLLLYAKPLALTTALSMEEDAALRAGAYEKYYLIILFDLARGGGALKFVRVSISKL